MAALSNVMENKLIDFLFRGQALGLTGATAAAGTGLANVYFALYTTDPTDAAAGVEVTGGSYARVAVACTLANFAGTQAAASTAVSSGTSGTTSNNAAVTFPAPTANWGVITHVGVFDASTAGTLLLYGPLLASKTVNNGDAAPVFFPAAFAFQIDN